MKDILCFHEVEHFRMSKYCIKPDTFMQIIKAHPQAELHFDDGRKGILTSGIYRNLVKLNRKVVLFLVPNFLKGVIPASEHYSQFLTLQDALFLKSVGFEIASHSMCHRDLKGLSTPALISDLQGSKEWLETFFKTEVTKFSYPFGSVDARVASEAEKIYLNCYSLDSNLGIRRTLVLSHNP